MADRDYYEIMGLTPGADRQMIDQAYWHLARKYQALASADAAACYLHEELNEAYGVLGTPRLREQYDAFRDDVLITRGIIQPVASKPKRRSKEAAEPKERGEAAGLRLPRLRIANWRWYGLAAVVTALAFAGAWQGVQPMFVLTALIFGLALSLTPALRRQLDDVSMPSLNLPGIAVADMRAPRIALPKLPDVNMEKLTELGIVQERAESVDPGVLQASTLAMIKRWRQSVGLRTLDYDNPLPDREVEPEVPGVRGQPAASADGEPSVVAHGSDVQSVINILRGSKQPQ